MARKATFPTPHSYISNDIQSAPLWPPGQTSPGQTERRLPDTAGCDPPQNIREYCNINIRI